jgi:hypothetical protein
MMLRGETVLAVEKPFSASMLPTPGMQRCRCTRLSWGMKVART